MAKAKKEPKPPVQLRFQVAADGKHPYYFASREGGGDPDYPERTELECVEVYVNRVLHPEQDCYVFAQEKGTPNWNTEVWNVYSVRRVGDSVYPPYKYLIEKVGNTEDAH